MTFSDLLINGPSNYPQKWVNCALVNSNFQLDVGSFTLNSSFNLETSDQNSNFREIQSDL